MMERSLIMPRLTKKTIAESSIWTPKTESDFRIALLNVLGSIDFQLQGLLNVHRENLEMVKLRTKEQEAFATGMSEAFQKKIPELRNAMPAIRKYVQENLIEDGFKPIVKTKGLKKRSKKVK